jgi:hypothetical protein
MQDSASAHQDKDRPAKTGNHNDSRDIQNLIVPVLKTMPIQVHSCGAMRVTARKRQQALVDDPRQRAVSVTILGDVHIPVLEPGSILEVLK